MLQKIQSLLFENQSLGKKIVKNAFWLFSGQILGRFIRAAIVIYAARVLGPASWGAFSYAMGLVAFLTIFSDVGVSAIVTRESARDPEISNKYFSTAFFIKLALLLLGAGVLLLGAPYLTKIEEAKTLLPLITLVLIFDSLRNFGFALSRAKEKMAWEGTNEIATNLFISLFGFLLLLVSPTSRSLTASYVLATGIGFLIISWQLKPYFKNLFRHFDYSLIKPILSAAWPFALASSLGAIMINTDMIMLGWFRSAEEVGWYAAAQRPVQLLYIFPTLFAASLFPTLTRLAHRDKEKFRSILETSLRLAIPAAVAITVIGVLFGNQIIDLLFGGAYQNAVAAFQILLFTILIIYPSAIITNAVFAYNEQKGFLLFSTLGAGGNILFNLLLIPPLGIAGCALATLITQLIANGFMWRKMKQINKFSLLSRFHF